MWIKIPGTKYHYINKQGKVKNTKTGRLIGHVEKLHETYIKGYDYYVTIHEDGVVYKKRSVREIMAEVFGLRKIKKTDMIINKNESFLDARLDNLQVVDRGEYMRHLYKMRQKRFGVDAFKNGTTPKFRAKFAYTKKGGKKKFVHLGYYEDADDAYDAVYEAYQKVFGLTPWTEEANNTYPVYKTKAYRKFFNKPELKKYHNSYLKGEKYEKLSGKD